MKVWVLIDKYNGDVKAVLNETGKRNVEKQLPEMKQMWFRYDKQTDSAYEIEPPVYNLVYKYAF